VLNQLHHTDFISLSFEVKLITFWIPGIVDMNYLVIKCFRRTQAVVEVRCGNSQKSTEEERDSKISWCHGIRGSRKVELWTSSFRPSTSSSLTSSRPQTQQHQQCGDTPSTRSLSDRHSTLLPPHQPFHPYLSTLAMTTYGAGVPLSYNTPQFPA
jgi:hypothetical protein